MKKFLRVNSCGLFMLFLAFLCGNGINGQTVLIDPAQGGGFELGTTFEANGWTAVNGTQTNKWFVGTAAVPNSGTNSAYVSSSVDGSTYAYNTSAASVVMIYQDIIIPTGENVLEIAFQWKGTAEGNFDYMRVWLAPTSYMPVAGTQTTIGNSNGIQLGGNFSAQAAYVAAQLAATVIPGNTYRLVFEWRNDTSAGGTPISIDDISVNSRPAGTFISVATGNWGTASTWDANAVPTSADNAIVSVGDVVTINATGQGISNLTVNGTLAYGTTPAQFNVNGNLTVSNGGLFNVFNATTGKTLFVSGNIVNNGRIDVSVGTTTAGNLTLNGNTFQSVTGTGVFGGTVVSTTNTNTVEVIRNLVFANTNTSIPNILWDFNVRVAYNLTFTASRVNLNGRTLSFGNYATANTLTAVVGTGIIDGTFNRFWTAGGTGTVITAGTDPTNATSRYPFLSQTGANRAMYISRTGGTTGSAAGYLAVSYVDDTQNTLGLSIDDAGYVITDRYEGNWVVTSSDGYVHNNGHAAVVLATGAYTPLNGNSRIMLANAPAGGTHQNGTITPAAQRIGMSLADLTAGPLHIGIASMDNQYPCDGTPLIPTISAVLTSVCQGETVVMNSTGTASNTTGLTYQWMSATTSGGPYTSLSGATGLNLNISSLPIGVNYIVLQTTCENSVETSLSNQLMITVNGGTIVSDPVNFCGVGGTSVLTLAASSSVTNVIWTSLTASASIVGANLEAEATLTETSDFQVMIEFDNGATCAVVTSIGVYPLPSATVTTSADGVCPGTSATINSGLSAGNFSSVSIPHAPRMAPATAVTLATGGVALVPQTGGNLDDGGWGNIPIGFDFNFFGTSHNSINVGTNGTLLFGAYNGAGLNDFTFVTLPSTTEPFNMIAVLAMDNNLNSADGGTLRYWTEGYTPNRKFVVSYEDVKEFGDTKYSTSQAILYETTGEIEVNVTYSTNIDRNKLVGVNNADGTIGVLAFASGTTSSATNPISNPFAFRFSPPSNFNTIWTATDILGTTEIANGVNIFSQNVAPLFTTTYSITYTNLITGCTNAPGSAEVVMNVLGSAAPTGITALASADNICVGQSITLSTDYTGSVEGLEFQWQLSTDGGAVFTNIPGAINSTYTATNQVVTTQYRLQVTSCGGLPENTSVVTVNMGGCILMTNGVFELCEGTLYDSGGPTGNYLNNENRTITLTPSTAGALMQITFTEFQVETCCDNLTVFNGNSVADPIIGTFTSNPGSITSTAADGSLTLRFLSDGSVTQSGWVANIACVEPASNDDVCNAITLVVDGSVGSYNNGGATVQLGESAIAPPVTGAQTTTGWANSDLSATVWFKFIAPSNGQIEVSCLDIPFDGQLAIYSVGNCNEFNSFILVAANDNEIGGNSTSPYFTYCGLTGGQEYYILFDSRVNGQTGEFSIKLSELDVSAGTFSGILNVCSGSSVDLFDGLENNDLGGIWSQETTTLGLTGSIFNSTGLAYQAFNFTYDVVKGCAVDQENIQVQIYGPSSAGLGGSVTVCRNEPFDLLSGLSGNVDLGGTWYDTSLEAISSSAISASNNPGQFNYYYITGNGVCVNDTALVLVNVSSTCNYLDVEEMFFGTMSIMPNPSNGVFNISNAGSTEVFNYEVTDLDGRLILIKDTAINGTETTVVDLTNNVTGMYMIRVYNDSAEKIFRVIKQ
jgi:hypothetical protein